MLNVKIEGKSVTLGEVEASKVEYTWADTVSRVEIRKIDYTVSQLEAEELINTPSNTLA